MTIRSARFAVVLLSASIWACGSSEPDDSATDAGTGYAASYVPDPAGLHVGKSHFQLALTSGGEPATGLASSLALKPLMQMAKMAHGGPVPIDAVQAGATAGSYDCTLFFPMASIDASGQPQGTWSLDVTVETEPAGTLDLFVSPAVGPDTTHATLKNAADTIPAMGGPKPRNWLLFRDGLEKTETGHAFTVFLATVQAGLHVWPPVTVGLELFGEDGELELWVESLELELSTDGNDWVPMTCDASARCTAALAGLPSGSSANVQVTLAVNGNRYTTDGSPPDAAKQNGFATFAVSAP